MSPDEFYRQFMTRIQLELEGTHLVVPGENFRLSFYDLQLDSGDTMQIDMSVARWYDAYKKGMTFDEGVEIVSEYIRNRQYDDAENTSWSGVQGRVRVRLESKKDLEYLQKTGESLGEDNVPVYRPFLGLNVFYVIDYPTTMAFVMRYHLSRWGIDEEALHMQALENTRRVWEADMPQPHDISFNPDNPEQTVRAYERSKGDGYDAVGVLFPDLLTSLVGGDAVVYAPVRDACMIVSMAEMESYPFIAPALQAWALSMYRKDMSKAVTIAGFHVTKSGDVYPTIVFDEKGNVVGTEDDEEG